MQLIINGRILSLETSWGDLEWGLCWPGYSDELTFDVGKIPKHLRPGSLVSLVWGGEALWSGTLDEPTRGEKLRAAGLYRLGEDYAALDSGGNLTLDVDIALAQAESRGLPWSWPVGSGYVASLSTDTPPSITDLVNDQFSGFPGWDWGVLPSGVVHSQERTAPRLHVRPGGDGLGIAWDNYASTLVARYLDSTSSVYETVVRTDSAAEIRWGSRETVVPGLLNDGAEMSSTHAENIVDSMLAKGRARPGWTTPIEVEYGGVTTNRGQPIELATIKPYETIRVHGISEDIGADPGQTYVDMPIERIRHDRQAKTAVLTPVGLVSPMHDVLQGKR